MALLTLAMIATAFTVIDAPAASAALVTNVPGVIQAEDYEDFLDTDPGNRGQASTFNDDVDVWPMIGGGYILGRVLDGEYTTYDINVAETGTYDFAIRNASGAALGGTATISIDDTLIAPPTSLGNSNGWWRFQTTSLGTAPLTAGNHELRIDWGAGQSNFDYLEITRAEGFTGVAANPETLTINGSLPAHKYSGFRDTTAGNSGLATGFTDDVDVWPNGSDYIIGDAVEGEYLEYDVNVPDGGVYSFSVVHASGSGGGTATISINGRAIAPAKALGGTGNWWSFSSADIGQAVLSSGDYKIRLDWGAGQSNFARIDIRQASAATGEADDAPRSTVPGIVEAEHYDRYRDLDVGNAGRSSAFTDDVDVWPAPGGNILGRVLNGEWATYDINVPETGDYAFEIRHASGAGGGTVTISVDGTPIAPATALGNTNGWWRFDTTTVGEATLNAGYRTIRVDFGPGQSNIDHFNIVEADPPPPPLPGYARTLADAPVWELDRVTTNEPIEAEYPATYFDTSQGNTGSADEFAHDLDVWSAPGGGHIVGDVFEGEFTTYELDVKNTGDYRIALRVASAGTSGTATVSIDGEPVAPPKVLGNTGGWWNLESKTIVDSIEIGNGRRTLRVDWGPGQSNFDRIEITWLPDDGVFSNSSYAQGAIVTEADGRYDSRVTTRDLPNVASSFTLKVERAGTSGGRGSVPSANAPGFSVLRVNTPGDTVVSCLVYRVKRQTAAGAFDWYHGDDAGWVFAAENCEPFDEDYTVDGKIFPTTRNDYPAGTYEVEWDIVAESASGVQRRSNSARPKITFVVPTDGRVGPKALGPSTALAGGDSVTLVAEEGWSEYRWAIVPAENEEQLTCDDLTGVRSTSPTKTVAWPSGGDGENYIWCVRARISDENSDGSMSYSPWSQMALIRSDDTRNRQFGSSPLYEMVEGVNTASGNWTFARTDVALNGVAPGLDVTRVYNAQARLQDDEVASQAFGLGWSTAFDSRLLLENLSESQTPELDSRQTAYELYRAELIDGTGLSHGVWLTNRATPFADGQPSDDPENTVLSDEGSTKTLEAISDGWRITGRDGSEVHFDIDGRLTKQIDPLGRVLHFDRAGGSRIAEIRDEVSGRTIGLAWTQYGSAWRVTGVTVPDPSDGIATVTWSYSYSGPNGRSLDRACRPPITGESGQSCEKYAWNGEGAAITSVYDADTAFLTTPNYQAVYDADLRVKELRTWPALNQPANLTKFDYNDSQLFELNASTTVTDARNNDWTYRFDQNGQLIEKDAPDVAGHAGITRYSYDDYRRTVIDTPNATAPDSERDITTFTYDDRGNLTQEVDGNGHSTFFYYNDDNMLRTECRDQAGPDNSNSDWCTVSRWDGFNLKNRTATLRGSSLDGNTPAQMATEAWTYSPSHQEIQTYTDGEGRTTRYDYYGIGDSQGKRGDVRTITYPSRLVHRLTYNAWGQIEETHASWPGQPEYLLSDADYNAVGLVASQRGPTTRNAVTNGSHQLVTTTAYKPTLTVDSVTQWDTADRAGTTRTTTLVHDRLGREIESQAPSVALVGGAQSRPTIKRTFDPNGNITAVRDANNVWTTTEWDKRNQQISLTIDGNTTSTEWTDNGLIEQTTDALGRKQRFTYDRGGRLVTTFERDNVAGDPWLVSNHVAGFVAGTDWPTKIQAGRTAGTAAEPTGVPGGAAFDRTTTFAYGPTGLVTTRIEDSDRPRTTTFGYKLDSQLATTTIEQDGRSTTTEFRYDDGAFLDKTTIDDGGANLAFESDLDPRGYAISSTDAEDFTTTFDVDAAGRTVRITQPNADTYDDHATLSTAAPAVSSVGFDAFGNATEHKNAATVVTTHDFDNLDRLVKVNHATLSQPGQFALSPTEQFAYDANGNLREEIARTGGRTTYTYNARNQVREQRQPAPQAGETGPVTRYDYDDVGNLQRITDPVGAVTTFTWNLWNQLATESRQRRSNTLSNGVQRPATTLVTEMTYDQLGYLETLTTPEDLTTSFDHDSLGRLRTRTEPGNRVTEMTYDYADRLLTIEDHRGFKTENVWDGAGRQTSTTDFGIDGSTISRIARTHDDNGNVLTETSRRGVVTEYEWDPRQRLQSAEITSVTPSVRNLYGYDSRDNLTLVTNGNDDTTTYVWNDWNLLATTREPATATTPGNAQRDFSSIFDSGGRTVRRIEPGLSVEVGVDLLGRVRSESVGQSLRREMQYDAGGYLRVARSTGASDVSFFYDDVGQLIESRSGATASTFDYDDDGRITSRNDSGIGEHVYTWTANNELDTHRDPVTGLTTTHYRYPNGQLRKVEVGANAARDFTYKADGRLATDRWSGNGTLYSERTYDYDLDDNVESEVRYQYRGAAGDVNCDGTLNILDVQAISQYTVGLRTAVNDCSGGASSTAILVSAADFTGDGLVDGRDTSQANRCVVDLDPERCPGPAGSAITYSYDLADRLDGFTHKTLADNGAVTETSVTEYGYDPAGNRRTQTTDGEVSEWTYDERNRLKQGPEGTYAWSERGTLESITSGAGVLNYDFNGFGQMTVAADTTYVYDGVGRLASRSAGGDAATFGYSGLGRDQVTDGASIYGRGPGGALTSLTDRGQARIAATDRFGDLMHVADSAGVPTSTITFDPFGAPLVRWGGVNQPSVGFQGDWTDPTTGDVNMDARWYAPSSATFRSRDTWMGELRTPVSLNRYTYANNNPIRYWDPSGRCAEIVFDVCIKHDGETSFTGTSRLDPVTRGEETATTADLETSATATLGAQDGLIGFDPRSAATVGASDGFVVGGPDNGSSSVTFEWTPQEARTVSTGNFGTPSLPVDVAAANETNIVFQSNSEDASVELTQTMTITVPAEQTEVGIWENGINEFTASTKQVLGRFGELGRIFGSSSREAVDPERLADSFVFGVESLVDAPGQFVDSVSSCATDPIGETFRFGGDCLAVSAGAVSGMSTIRNLPTRVPGTNVPGGSHFPRRTLPSDKHGVPVPDVDLPHTQFGMSKPKYGSEPQAREWDYGANGNLQPQRDIDFSDHGSPSIHPNPHQHALTPNNPTLAPKGGYQRGPHQPF